VIQKTGSPNTLLHDTVKSVISQRFLPKLYHRRNSKAW